MTRKEWLAFAVVMALLGFVFLGVVVAHWGMR